MSANASAFSTSKLSNFRTHECPISPKTSWLFLEVVAEDGSTGVGEISHFGVERGVMQMLPGMIGALMGLSITEAICALSARQRRMVAEVPRILLSGIEQALLDLQAKSLGVSPMDLIGGQKRSEIALYANINRGTVDRTPEGWAARALEAKRDGYASLKMAPFDGVDAAALQEPEGRKRVHHGLACVNAVRDAVGSDMLINVDLHGRLNLFGARQIIRELEAANPFWIEAPIRENSNAYDDIAKIRSFANDLGIKIAGGELVTSLSDVIAMVKADVQDVYLPDIRLCSGVREAVTISQYLSCSNLEFSLHNPAGPVLDVISQTVAAAAESTTIIERQYKEHPLQLELLSVPLVHPKGGILTVERSVGWGVNLDQTALACAVGPNDATIDLFGYPGAGPNS